ncbi:MAG: GTP-binding protein, partial [Hyphomonas sp.]
MTGYPIVVIGHVDHGKTALVRALTGTDTDRLEEEKRRGVSILPGFAFLEHDGQPVDLIDAPGHSDYLRAMITSASGARGALIAISAAEGIAAQTLEHIMVAGGLGISEAVVAVTKSDLMAPGSESKREAELRAALSATPFAEAPLVFCSAVTGEGLSVLCGALAALAARTRDDTPPPGAFLPVDRVFVAQGQGTVVTGTLLGGAVGVNDTLTVSPSGHSVTVRGIEVRGKATRLAIPGARTALNLRGLPAGALRPGDVLHAPERFAPTCEADAVLFLPAARRLMVRHMAEVRVHCAAAQASAHLQLYGASDLATGEDILVRLKFRGPVCVFEGQRVILRRPSPAETLGAALILDAAPGAMPAGKRARQASLAAASAGDLQALAEALSAEGRGAARLADIARLARRPAEGLAEALQPGFVAVGGNWLVPAAGLQAARDAYLGALSAYHAAFPLRLFAPRAGLASPRCAPVVTAQAEADLAAAGAITLTATGAAMAGHAPADRLSPAQKMRLDALETALKEAGLN